MVALGGEKKLSIDGLSSISKVLRLSPLESFKSSQELFCKSFFMIYL